MKLTDEQRCEVVKEEMEYQLDIMGQYLEEEQRDRYLKVLQEYSNILEFEQFCRKIGITE